MSVYANKGIAIQTTFARLERSINAARNSIQLSKVLYIDHNKDAISNSDPSYLFVVKRKSFDYEQELRAFISPYDENKHGNLEKTKSGVYVPVDLVELCERIYVSPQSENYFMETIQGLLKAFDLDMVQLMKSEI